MWQRHRSAPYRENTLNHQAHTTPVIARARDDVQLITVAADQTHAYHPLTGEELWHVRYEGFANVACPILDEPKKPNESHAAYVVTGFGKTELWKVRINGKGNVTSSNILWRARKQMPKLPTPVLVDGRFTWSTIKGLLHVSTPRRAIESGQRGSAAITRLRPCLVMVKSTSPVRRERYS